MNVNDRIFLSPRFPLNTKLYNARRTDYSIIIETIPEYLARVLTYDRPIGVDITILAPPGEIMLQDIMSGAEVLTFSKYRFENGVEDSDFTLLTDFNEWLREDPVNFDDHSIITDSVQFNLTPTVTPIAGELFWDELYTTLSFQLPDGGTIQINQEPFDYYHNIEGSTIVNGDIVSTCGASGNRTAICLTDATDDVKATSTFGMVATSSILNDNVGRVTKSGGRVIGLNTSIYSEGDILYVDPLNPGKWTNITPVAPLRSIKVGTVVVSDSSNGIIELQIQIVPKMIELTDVNSTPLTASGQFPIWDNDNEYFNFSENINDYKHAHYCPSIMTVSRGTLLQGTVADLCEIGGTDVIIQELSGADPLTVSFTFNNVARMTSFAFYGDYDGGAGHIVNVEAYNYTNSTWDNLGQIATVATKQWYSFNIFLPNNYLDSGNVQIRVKHQDNGIPSHELTFDYVDVNYGGAGGGTSIGASAVSFIPSGGIAGTNVQSAIQELDSEKMAKVTSTDNAVVRFDGITGSVQNSGVTVDDSNNLTAASLIKSGGLSTQFLKADGSVDTNVAPASGSANYVQVSPVSAQDGNIWISGNITSLSSSFRTNITTDGYVAIQPGSNTVQGYIEWYKPNNIRVGYMGYFDGTTANDLSVITDNGASFKVFGHFRPMSDIFTSAPIHFATDVWNVTTDNVERFYFSPNGTTYFKTGNDFQFRNSIGNDIVNISQTGVLSATGYKLSNTDLLLDNLRTGSIGASGTILTSVGVSSQPTWQTINQSIGGNALTDGYIPNYDLALGRLENSPIYTNGTNIGVNTNNPYQKLDVRNGVITVTTSDFSLGTSGSVLSISLGESTGNTFSSIQSSINGDYTVGNLSFNRFGGNVGIGYSTGTEITNNKLAVNGSGYFNGRVTSISDYGFYNYQYGGGYWWNNTGLRLNGLYFQDETNKIVLRSLGSDLISFYGGEIDAPTYKRNGNDLFGNLTSGYLPYWDGGKLVNSLVTTNAKGIDIQNTSGDQSRIRIISGESGLNRASRIDFLNVATSSTIPAWTLLNDYYQTGLNSFGFANQNGLVIEMLQNGNVGFGYQYVIGETLHGSYKVAVNGSGYFNTNLTVNGLASNTNTRLVTASATGQLANIADGTNGQFLKTDGAGNYSFGNSPEISSGSGSPSSTPNKIGDFYIDITNFKLYFSKGASSSADWIIAN